MEENQPDIKKILAEREKIDRILESEFTKKITVMFTDIKGSTSFYEARGDIDGRVMVHKHNEIVLPVIRENNCLFIKTIGDGTMSVFEDPLSAVRAAVGIQKRLKVYNSDKTENQQILVRIGLNLGTGLVEEQDVHGDVVNVAARVEAVADAGQIMITEDMYKEIKNDEDLIFRYFDSVKLKGKKDPLKVYSLIWHEQELAGGARLRSGEVVRKREGVFVLEAIRTGSKMKVSGFERAEGEERAVRSYEDIKFNEDRIKDYTKGITDLLNRANRRGKIGNDLLIKLKEYGGLLFDELIPVQMKEKISKTTEKNLMISIDDKLVHIPWELLYDGKDFFCQRFSMGRTVSTRQPVSVVVRSVGRPLKMQILADPRGDLAAAYEEGVVIKNEIGKFDDCIDVSLKTTDTRIDYVRAKIRNFDIVHYAGHAEHDSQNPADSGWLLKDGKISAGDIINMTGVMPMPSLVFSNACQSGQTGEWKLGEDYEDRIFGLANAFLLSGVQHYLGTFWEIPDEASSYFAIHFYRNLVNGVSIGEALRLSRHALIEKYGEDTIVWASYMLYGDPTTVYVGQFRETAPLEPEEKFERPGREELVGQELRGAEQHVYFPQKEKRHRNMVIAGVGLVLLAGLGVFMAKSGMLGGSGPKQVPVVVAPQQTAPKMDSAKIDELVAGLAKNYREGKFAQSGAAADDWSTGPLTMVFLDIKSGEGAGDANEKKLTGLLTQKLQEDSRVNIVEREILDKLLAELKLSSSALADPTTSLKIGKLLSAKLIVTGSIMAEGKGQAVMLRLIDTETTAIRKSVSSESQKKEIDRELTNDLAKKISDFIKAEMPVRGKVVSVAGNVCTVNLGQAHGLKKGDRLEIVTEASKGSGIYVPAGELEISETGKDKSQAAVISTKNPLKEGARIRWKA